MLCSMHKDCSSFLYSSIWNEVVIDNLLVTVLFQCLSEKTKKIIQVLQQRKRTPSKNKNVTFKIQSQSANVHSMIAALRR